MKAVRGIEHRLRILLLSIVMASGLGFSSECPAGFSDQTTAVFPNGLGNTDHDTDASHNRGHGLGRDVVDRPYANRRDHARVTDIEVHSTQEYTRLLLSAP
jgi:hypothetical protein